MYKSESGNYSSYCENHPSKRHAKDIARATTIFHKNLRKANEVSMSNRERYVFLKKIYVRETEALVSIDREFVRAQRTIQNSSPVPPNNRFKSRRIIHDNSLSRNGFDLPPEDLGLEDINLSDSFEELHDTHECLPAPVPSSSEKVCLALNRIDSIPAPTLYSHMQKSKAQLILQVEREKKLVEYQSLGTEFISALSAKMFAHLNSHNELVRKSVSFIMNITHIIVNPSWITAGFAVSNIVIGCKIDALLLDPVMHASVMKMFHHLWSNTQALFASEASLSDYSSLVLKKRKEANEDPHSITKFQAWYLRESAEALKGNFLNDPEDKKLVELHPAKVYFLLPTDLKYDEKSTLDDRVEFAYANSSTFPKSLALLQSYLSKDSVELQSEDKENIVVLIWNTLKNIFASIFKLENYEQDKADKISKHVTSVGNMFKSLKNFFADMYGLISEAFKWVYRIVTGVPYALAGKREMYDDYLEVQKNVPDLISSTERYTDPQVSQQVIKYSSMIDRLIPQFDQFQDASYSKKLRALKMNLQTAAFHVSTAMVGRGSRQEPIGIILRGGPGVGKTLIVNSFAAALNKLDGKPSSPNLVYTVNRESDYHDNYAFQNVVLLDECFQSTNAEDLRSERNFVFQFLNTAILSLEKSAVEDKGRFTCTSEFVFLSTNKSRKDILALSMVEPEAFKRRIPFDFTLVNDTGDYADPNAMVFLNDGIKLSFKEVLYHVHAERVRRREVFNGINRNVDALLSTFELPVPISDDSRFDYAMVLLHADYKVPFPLLEQFPESLSISAKRATILTLYLQYPSLCPSFSDLKSLLNNTSHTRVPVHCAAHPATKEQINSILPGSQTTQLIRSLHKQTMDGESPVHEASSSRPPGPGALDIVYKINVDAIVATLQDFREANPDCPDLLYDKDSGVLIKSPTNGYMHIHAAFGPDTSNVKFFMNLEKLRKIFPYERSLPMKAELQAGVEERPPPEAPPLPQVLPHWTQFLSLAFLMFVTYTTDRYLFSSLWLVFPTLLVCMIWHQTAPFNSPFSPFVVYLTSVLCVLNILFKTLDPFPALSATLLIFTLFSIFVSTHYVERLVVRYFTRNTILSPLLLKISNFCTFQVEKASTRIRFEVVAHRMRNWAGLVIAVGLVAGIIGVSVAMFSRRKKVNVEQLMYSGMPQHKIPVHEKRQIPQGKVVNVPGLQTQASVSEISALSRGKLSRNLGFISSDDGFIKSRFFAFGGTVVRVPYHAFAEFTPNIIVTLHNGVEYQIALKNCKIVTYAESDFCDIQLPKIVPSFPEAAEFFCTEEDAHDLPDKICRVNSDEFFISTQKATISYLRYTDSVTDELLSCSRGIYFQGVPGKAGDCMSTFCFASPRFENRFILAFQISGSPDGSYGHIVTQEIVKAAMAAFSNTSQTLVDSDDEDLDLESRLNDHIERMHEDGYWNRQVVGLRGASESMTAHLDHLREFPETYQFQWSEQLLDIGNLPYTTVPEQTMFGEPIPSSVVLYGTLPPKFQVRMVNKTSISPSPIQGHPLLPAPKTAPAALVPNSEGLSPAVNGIRKMMDMESDITEEEIEWACADLYKSLACTFELGRQDLSLHQALNGTTHTTLLRPVDPTTSAGYHPLDPKGPGKSMYMIKDPKTGILTLTDLGKLRYTQYKERLYHSTDHVIHQSTFKDELRPLEKVAKCSTRIFSTPQWESILIEREYLGAWLAAVHQNYRNQTGQVGISQMDEYTFCVYDEWKDLDILDWDQAAYDYHHKLPLTRAHMRAINKNFYRRHRPRGYSNHMRMQCCEMNAVSIHIMGKYLYSLNSSMISGGCKTAEWNSEYSDSITMIAIRRVLIANIKFYSMSRDSLSTYFRKKSYGDDYVLGKKKDFLPEITIHALSVAFNDMGFEITNPDKTPITPDQPYSKEFSFLKRTFVFRDGYPYFVLDKDVIKEIPLWCKKGKDSIEVFHSTINASLQEMALHGKTEFDLWQNQLYRACVDRNCPFVLKSWNEFMSTHASRVGVRANMTVRRIKVTPVSDPVPSSSSMPLETPNDNKLISNSFIAMTQEVIPALNENFDPTVPNEMSLTILPPDQTVVHATPFNPNPYADMTPEKALIIPVQDGASWTSASTGILKAYNYPAAFLASGRFHDILSDYRYFNGRGSVRITYNGSSTVYGNLLVAYVPAGGPADLDLARLSQYDHVILEAATDGVQSFEFDIPWTYPLRAIDWSTYNGDLDFDSMGTFYVAVMSPLGSTQPGVAPAVTVNFERFIRVPKVYGQHDSIAITNAWNNQTSTPRWAGTAWHPNLVSQASHAPRPANVKEADKKSEKGILSSTLAAGGTFASALSRVPGLGPVASIAASSLELGSKVASHFGFEKPMTEAAPQVSQLRMLPDITHCEGLDSSTSLSYKQSCYTSDSLVNPLPDEMDFDTICAKPSLIFQADTLNTAVANSLVCSIAGTPSIPLLYGNNGVSTNCSFTNIGFVADYFRKWRGELMYKVVVSASPFHSGELIIAHSPMANAPAALGQPGYFNTISVPINGPTTFEVPLRWLTNQDWLSTKTFFGAVSGTERCCNGSIGIYVRKAITLRGDVTNASNVRISIFLSGKLQFTEGKSPFPRNTVVVPSFFMADSLADKPTKKSTINFAEVEALLKSQGFPGASTYVDGEEAYDSIKSFRDVIKRSSLIQPATSVVAAQPGTVLPHWDAVVSDHTYTSLKWHFWKGYASYKMMQDYLDAPTSNTLIITQDDGGFAAATAFGTRSLGGVLTTKTGYSPTLEYAVPYYASAPFRPVVPYTAGSQLAKLPAQTPIYAISVPTADYTRLVSFGDDFSFYCLGASPRFSTAGVF